MQEYDQLEQEIIKAIEAFSEETNDTAKFAGNSKPWTEGIKRNLALLATEKDYEVCTSGLESQYNSEWLYDMVWYKEEGEGKDKRIVEVALVMECEWRTGFSDIKCDFEKLLVANASHRLFIGSASASHIPGLLVYFEDAINKYKQATQGDRFLIAMLDYNSWEIQYKLIIKTISYTIQEELHNEVELIR